MNYKEINLECNKKIQIFDDVFTYSFRQSLYNKLIKMPFKIGWNDDWENGSNKFFHSLITEEFLKEHGFFKFLEQDILKQDFKDLNFKFSVLNLSLPIDSYLTHTHLEKKALLYYVNLDWQNEWHGETNFYDESGKNMAFSTCYTPGRIIIFDADIPHALRPQSIKSPKFRLTLTIFFDS